jgi:uncharacterized protein YigE (DUF2233 family)
MNSIVPAAAALGMALALAGSAPGPGVDGVRFGRAPDALAIREAGGWVTWWRSDAAPGHWGSEAPLESRVVWRPGAAGMAWGQVQLRGASEAWRTRVVLVRLDPRTVGLSLVPSFIRNESWTVADADSAAVVALDAGQFRQSLPWGWVVSKGREILAPQHAPLAGAVVVEASGAVRIVAPDSLGAERIRGTAREAFQSFPMLLQNGVVPAALRKPGSGVDLAHRDARLAIGTLADGHVIIALTRFDALGEALGRVPLGLTTPEMAAVMGALGCRHALLLDGGISGQLMVREAEGSVRSWPGTRSVPLGLVGWAR